MFVYAVRRVRRVLVTVLLLLLVAGSLVVAGGLLRLSAAPAVRADGGESPPLCYPKPCPTTTAKRATVIGLPPPPFGGTLAQGGGPAPFPWPGSGTLADLGQTPADAVQDVPFPA